MLKELVKEKVVEIETGFDIFNKETLSKCKFFDKKNQEIIDAYGHRSDFREKIARVNKSLKNNVTIQFFIKGKSKISTFSKHRTLKKLDFLFHEAVSENYLDKQQLDSSC